MCFTAAVLICCSDQPTAPLTAFGAKQQNTPAVSSPLSSLGWHEEARALVAANRLTAYAAGRLFGILGVAQYRAVLEVDAQFATGQHGVDGQLATSGLGTGGRSLLEARRGAVAGSSAQVLSYVFSDSAARFERRVETEADEGPGGVHPSFTRGLAIGRSAGDALVERAKIDNFNTSWPGTVPTGVGVWLASGPPAGTNLLVGTPFLLNSRDQFRPPPPPAFGSQQFLTALSEIRTLSDTRTPAQRASAVDWNYGTGTFTPPGYWNLTGATYIESHSRDERAATHVFALMHASIYDALIACWDAKYHYWTIRPSQADPLIALTFALPNHPSYPSGHSCGSGAAETVLSYFFSDRAAELADSVIEAGLSRMYAGIHYRFDVETGRNLGNTVARWAIGVDQTTGLLSALR